MDETQQRRVTASAGCPRRGTDCPRISGRRRSRRQIRARRCRTRGLPQCISAGQRERWPVGPGDRIDFDPLFLEVPYHANVGESPRDAACEDESDSGPFDGGGSGIGPSRRSRQCQQHEHRSAEYQAPHLATPACNEPVSWHAPSARRQASCLPSGTRTVLA